MENILGILAVGALMLGAGLPGTMNYNELTAGDLYALKLNAEVGCRLGYDDCMTWPGGPGTLEGFLVPGGPVMVWEGGGYVPGPGAARLIRR